MILTIQITIPYFKSLFIAQKDTHGESFFYLFGSINKEQLETSLWFDGAGNNEGLEW